MDDLEGLSRDALKARATTFERQYRQACSDHVTAMVEIEQLRAACAVDIRAFGWSVAVHNDYRQLGEPFTFWLVTHPDGRWLKGEGQTDSAALDQIRAAISSGMRGT